MPKVTMGYAKKRKKEEKKMSIPKGMREKKMPKSMKKRKEKERKKEIKIAHTSKVIIQKRESHDERSTKNIRIRKIFYTLARLDQSV